MTILAMVNADKEGQIESKMMKARQMEEIREARKKEAEARQEEKKSKLVGWSSMQFGRLNLLTHIRRRRKIPFVGNGSGDLILLSLSADRRLHPPHPNDPKPIAKEFRLPSKTAEGGLTPMRFMALYLLYV